MSDNVFADIGLPNAEEHLAKAEIVVVLSGLIRERKTSQVEIAKVLGATQAEVSQMLRGRWEGMSLDRLIKMLKQLGVATRLTIERKDGLSPELPIASISL